MKKILLITLAILLVTGTVLSSCTQSAPAPTTTPQASTQPIQTTTPRPTTATTPRPTTTTTPTVSSQYGGILKIIISPGLTSIGNPAVNNLPGDGTLARPAVEALIGWDEAGTETPVPQLATGWQISPDYKSLKLTLRQGVKFHDGTDFNAQTAKYCLDISRKIRTELKSVTSVDILDDYTIRLNLAVYEPTLLGLLTGWPTCMLSPTALKSMGEESKFHPVGTGPFKFVKYQRDTLLKYEKFDSYWQKDKPYLDGIEFAFVLDPVTQVVSFKAGEADAIMRVTPNDAISLKAMDKYNFYTYYSAVYGLAGDSAHSNSVFTDIRVRRAIAYAIDNASVATLGKGYYQATNQLRVPGSYGFNPDVKGYPYNPLKSRQLLAEAGYPSGFETKLLFESTTKDLFTTIQGYLAEVGIKVTLDLADSARFRESCSKGWYNQLVSFDIPCSVGMDPGRALASRLANESVRYDPKSLGRTTDFDTLLAQSNTEFDPDKRLSMLKRLQKMIIDDYCLVMPIYAPGSVRVDSKRVHDFTPNTYGGPQDWQPAKVWLSK